jgi:hypothetical protein
LIGSDEQKRALGSLILDFGAADEGLDHYISSVFGRLIIETPDLAGQLQEKSFSEKVTLCKTVIECISDHYSVDGSRLFSQLDAVSGMARHRNDIVHGWVQWDTKGQRPVFRNSIGAPIS